MNVLTSDSFPEWILFFFWYLLMIKICFAYFTCRQVAAYLYSHRRLPSLGSWGRRITACMRLVWSTLCVLGQWLQSKALSNLPPLPKKPSISDLYFFFFNTSVAFFSSALKHSIFLLYFPCSPHLYAIITPTSLPNRFWYQIERWVHFLERIGWKGFFCFVLCFVGSRQKLRYRSLLCIPS